MANTTDPEDLVSSDWFLAVQWATDLNVAGVTPWEPRGFDADLDASRSTDAVWVWHDGSLVLEWVERSFGWEAV